MTTNRTSLSSTTTTVAEALRSFWTKHLEFLSRYPYNVLLGGFIRVFLVFYSEWHDEHFQVPFTDIDYGILNSSAGLVYNYFLKKGLFIEPFSSPSLFANPFSPYNRTTYRYSPILSYLLLPNHYFGCKYLGKLIFVLFDILTGILLSVSLPFINGESGQVFPDRRTKELATTFFWLWNPLVFGISARGSAESLICFFVVLVFYYLSQRKYLVSGLVYGLSVHLKIFPILFSCPLFFWFRERAYQKTQCKKKSLWKWILNSGNEFLGFFFAAGLCFLVLGNCFYYLYGYPFLYESYLHHIVRKDHRHNFSIYYYYFYLVQGFDSSVLFQSFFSLVGFLPQVLLVLVFGKSLSSHLPFACFILTFLFVTFNKVCTSQYFLWYICLIPLVCCDLDLGIKKLAGLVGLWLGSQALWLNLAYKLEFLGQNKYLELWMASLGFFLVNVYIIGICVQSYFYCLKKNFKKAPESSSRRTLSSTYISKNH